MTSGYCDVEVEDDDDERQGEDLVEEGGVGYGIRRQKVNTIECRCGDVFEVLDEDVQPLIRCTNGVSSNEDSTEWDGICEFQRCGLTWYRLLVKRDGLRDVVQSLYFV